MTRQPFYLRQLTAFKLIPIMKEQVRATYTRRVYTCIQICFDNGRGALPRLSKAKPIGLGRVSMHVHIQTIPTNPNPPTK